MSLTHLALKLGKKKIVCLSSSDRPSCLAWLWKVFFFNLKKKICFIKIQNYIIRKRCWNCQQSITHVHNGIWEFRSLQDRIRHSLIFMNIISGVGNTVAKMADAMDTTDMCTLAIEVKHGPKSLINIISTYKMKMTLSEVFDVVSKDLQEMLVQVQVSAKEDGCPSADWTCWQF